MSTCATLPFLPPLLKTETIPKEHFQRKGCHSLWISEGSWARVPPRHNCWTTQLGICSAGQASKQFHKSSGNKRCMTGQQIEHLKGDWSWVEFAATGVYCAGRQQPVAGWKLPGCWKTLRVLRASSSSSSSGAAGKQPTVPIPGLVWFLGCNPFPLHFFCFISGSWVPDNSKQSYFTLFPSHLSPENQLLPCFQIGLK